MKNKNKFKGSILVFSLIIMFTVLVAIIGIFSVSSTNRRAALDTGKSAVAFQVADSGMEEVLKKIKQDSYTTVNDLDVSGGMDCNVVDGVAVISDAVGDGSYALTFKNASDADISDCNSTDTIESVKSVGNYSETSRAIEVSIGNSFNCGVDTVDDADGNPYDTVKIAGLCITKENLNVGNVSNRLNNVTDNPSSTGQIEKWCYNDIPSNCNTYGGLYSWYEAVGLDHVNTDDASDPINAIIPETNLGINNYGNPYNTGGKVRGICPANWHIMSDVEWNIILTDLATGTCNFSTTNPGCHPAGTELKVGGTSGFDAPADGGMRDSDAAGTPTPTYDNAGPGDLFLSSTIRTFGGETLIWGYEIKQGSPLVWRTGPYKADAGYVRCIMD